MKKITLIILLFFTFTNTAWACDESLVRFSRDCQIQDRIAALRDRFTALKMNIDEVAEYKVVRFIDRSSWEWAKRFKIAPTKIYDPAPVTWNIWNDGIDQVLTNRGKDNLYDSNNRLDADYIALINKVLLTQGDSSISASKNRKPGEYRSLSGEVGFCDKSNKDFATQIKMSEASLLAFQIKWENQAGAVFVDVAREYGAQNPDKAVISSFMSEGERGCENKVDNIFVNYAPATVVDDSVSWVVAFIQANIDLYRQGRGVLAPIEFAAVVQKWLVSIHPFGDGNGRTSRAVQDIILAHFGLPLAPAGDLLDDATMPVNEYVEANYKYTESMLSELEYCAKKIEKDTIFTRKPFQCKMVHTLLEKAK